MMIDFIKLAIKIIKKSAIVFTVSEDSHGTMDR